MGKNNRKTTIAIISLIIVVVGIIAGVIKGYASLEAEVEHQGKGHIEAIETIKVEGCLLARQTKTDIQLVQKDVEILKEGQKTMDGKLDELLRR